jgi:hypothetical protein
MFPRAGGHVPPAPGLVTVLNDLVNYRRLEGMYLQPPVFRFQASLDIPAGWRACTSSPRLSNVFIGFGNDRGLEGMYLQPPA